MMMTKKNDCDGKFGGFRLFYVFRDNPNKNSNLKHPNVKEMLAK